MPWGLRSLLVWIKQNYGNPIVYITENGYAGNGTLINDKERISFHKVKII